MRCKRCGSPMIYNKLTNEWYCLLCGTTYGDEAKLYNDGLVTNFYTCQYPSRYGHNEAFSNQGIHVNLNGGG